MNDQISVFDTHVKGGDLCHHKPTCEMATHDSWHDKEIRSNPFFYLCIQHAANQKIGISRQPMDEFQGFKFENFIQECIMNH